MKGHLILIKHSLPDVVENVPAREWKLSKEGRRRAARLGERLIPYHPEILFSSTETKATETAEIVGQKLHLPVNKVENLHEHERSTIAFLSKEKFESSVHELFEKPDSLVFGSETANQAYKRFSKAVYSIRRIHKNKTVVIVSHGTVISLFVSHLTGISDYSVWKELGLPSFVVLEMQSKTLVAKENIS